MGFLRTMVKLAAVGVAANMVLKARREGSANRTTGSVGPGAALPTGPSTLQGGSSRAGIGATGIDSPNDADRLQARGFGDSSTVAGGDTERMFGSTSKEGATARTPGLADYARGA